MVKKSLSLLLVISLMAASFVGCGDDSDEGVPKNDRGNKVFKAFFATAGNEMTKDNRCQKAIEDKIGATCEVTWLAGQTDTEAVGTIIANEDFPDFIDGGGATQQLIGADALEPIDEHWDDYPNIKNYLPEKEWEKLRQEDGHIYIIPQFDNSYKEDSSTYVNGEAFWIQNKVLKWANYPEVETLDEYFDLIEKYIKENPEDKYGQKHVGYECLSEGDKYFCLENAPFFLDGYPNDGCCIIDPKKVEAIDYNTTPTAKRYFNKLNEEYSKGIIDQEAFTLTYDKYKEKISQGIVLGMCDQYWNFRDAELTLKGEKKNECEYIPLDVTIDKGIKPQYYNNLAISANNGLGICSSSKDIEGAFKFVDDLLTPDVMKLRFWGEEGTDYLVKDENGKKVYYRDEKMRENANNQQYKNENICNYEYFPFFRGLCLDDSGNAYSPEFQPEEFYESLSPEMKDILDHYKGGVKRITDLVEKPEENNPWFPMWSYTNGWTNETDYGKVKVKMDEVKHKQLPQVVRADNFDSAWNEYMEEYNKNVDVKCYLDALTKEAKRRNDLAKKFEK